MYVHTGQKCKFHAFPHPKSYFLTIFTYSDQWFWFIYLFPQLQIVLFRISSLQIAMTIFVLFFTISSHVFPLDFSLYVRFFH